MYGYDSNATIRNVDDHYRNSMNYYQTTSVYSNISTYNGNSENSERDERLRRAINKWIYQ